MSSLFPENNNHTSDVIAPYSQSFFASNKGIQSNDQITIDFSLQHPTLFRSFQELSQKYSISFAIGRSINANTAHKYGSYIIHFPPVLPAFLGIVRVDLLGNMYAMNMEKVQPGIFFAALGKLIIESRKKENKIHLGIGSSVQQILSRFRLPKSTKEVSKTEKHGDFEGLLIEHIDVDETHDASTYVHRLLDTSEDFRRIFEQIRTKRLYFTISPLAIKSQLAGYVVSMSRIKQLKFLSPYIHEIFIDTSGKMHPINTMMALLKEQDTTLHDFTKTVNRVRVELGRMANGILPSVDTMETLSDKIRRLTQKIKMEEVEVE